MLIACDRDVDCLKVLLKAGLMLPGFDSGGTYLIDPITGEMSLTGHHGLSERFVNQVAIFPRDEAASLLVNKKVIFLGHRDEFPSDIRDVMCEEGLAAAAILPLLRGGELVGSLHLATRHKRGVLKSGRLALESLAGLAQSAFETIAGRQEWLKTERHLRMAVQGTGLGVWKADLKTRRFFASARTRAMHHVPVDQPLTVETAQRAFHPDDLPRFISNVRRCMEQGGGFSLEYRTADGSHWIEVEAGYFPDPTPRFMGIVRDVTQRKLEEQRLAESGKLLEEMVASQTEELAGIHASLLKQAAMLQLVLESSGAGLREIDFAGNRMLMDDRACRLFGYPPGSVVTPDQLIGERIHPDHRAELRIKLSQLGGNCRENLWEHDSRILHPERGERWINGRGVVVRDPSGKPVSIRGIVIDVTERRHMGRMLQAWNGELADRLRQRIDELEASLSRCRMLSAAAVEGVVISHQGIVIDANEALAEMVGWPVERMIGRPVMEFVPPDDRDQVSQRIASGSEVPYESRLLNRDGDSIPVICNPRMTHRAGMLVRVTVLRNLSDLRRKSRELEQQRSELINHRSLALISEVNAGVVEQFREPLARVSSTMAGLKQRLVECRMDTAETVETVDDIKEDLERMREIIEHIGLLAGHSPVNPVSVPLDILLDELAPLLRREAGVAGVPVVIEPVGKLPAVPIDGVQIKQVLVNLVRNAVESCLECRGRPGLITVTATYPGGSHAEITVRDNGRGLDGDSMKRLFTPFFTTKRNGTGIGLRLCATIMSAHGGSITAANNEPDAGACFTIRIPLERGAGT